MNSIPLPKSYRTDQLIRVGRIRIPSPSGPYYMENEKYKIIPPSGPSDGTNAQGRRGGRN